VFFVPFFLAVQQSFIAASDPGHSGRGSPAVEIPRIEAEVAIDGRLDEPVWARAARLTDFSQYEPIDGRPAQERTEVLVWYAPDAIHFGIIAYDSRPDAIRATVADRDNIDGDDHVVLYLDTFNDRRRAFFFAVNPLGVQQDGVRTEGGGSAGRTFGGSTDKSPDYWYESRGRITEEGYVVEVRIPFKSLRLPGSGPQSWGFQVERKIQRTGYTDTWTDARKASASFLRQAGTLTGLRDLHRGVVLEAQPVLTATADGVRDPETRAFDRGSVEPEVGVNFHVGFTSLALDATVNPDFSQVEADAGQVTANERFALFFNEKRPFFLEGIELLAAPSQLVYTRRIVDPLAGAKVTGKLGGVSVAHLTALDEAAGGDALFNITRLRSDFGESSLAGILYTDRTRLEGEGYNRVLAADVRHVFGRMYFAEAQFGQSWTRDETGVRDAPLWKLEVDRTGRHWGFNYRIDGIGDDFVTESGYVRRSGVVTGSAFNRLTYLGGAGSTVERINLVMRPERVWRYGNVGLDRAIEGGESVDVSVRLRGGWEIGVEAGRDFYVLDPVDYGRYTVLEGGTPTPYRPLDEVSGPSFEVSGKTPVFQGFNASASAGIGRQAIFAEGSEGRVTALDGEVALRPNASLRLALSATYQRITRERDGSEFARTVIPYIKAEYQPTRALFFRAIGEFRSERRAALADARTGAPLLIDDVAVSGFEQDGLRLDLLASYEPVPGTVAFFGYGSSLARDRVFGPTVLERTSDGFFVKLAYRFRR